MTSDDVWDRYNGVRVLARFKSPENAAALAAVLNDPLLADYRDARYPLAEPYLAPGKWHSSVYPFRKVAYEALRGWGTGVPQTWVVREPKYRTTWLPPWIVPVAAGAALLLLALAAVAVWPAPRRGRRLSIVCGVLLAACAALGLRGRWRIDDVSFTAGGSRYEVAVLGGEVRLLRIDTFADPAPPSFTTVVRTPKTQGDWALTPVPPIPSRVARHAGFSWGTMTLGVAGTTSPVRFATLPLSHACVVLACPLVFLLGGALRRRYRHAAGRCPACGYDLRASPAGCPECGRGR